MPRMIPDKKQINEAINDYLEDCAIEKAEADRIRAEIDSCYAAYNAAKDREAQEIQEQIDTLWYYYELFQMRDDDNEASTVIGVQNLSDSELEEIMADAEMPTGPIKNMKSAKRRKQTAAAKKRLGRKAKDARNNMAKRMDEDMKGASIRGGRVVHFGKGGSIKAAELMERAKKMGFDV